MFVLIPFNQRAFAERYADDIAATATKNEKTPRINKSPTITRDPIWGPGATSV